MRDAYVAAQETLLLGLNVRNAVVYPHWSTDSETFWYERDGRLGKEYALVEAKAGKVVSTFVRAHLIDMLKDHLGIEISDEKLIISNVSVSVAGISFGAFGRAFTFKLGAERLEEETPRRHQNWVMSPIGDRAIVLKDDNLFIRDIESGTERALTHNGNRLNAYGSPPLTARQARASFGGVRPEVNWSPDGKSILTLQTDDREVEDLPLVEFAPIGGRRPRVHVDKVAFPGDPTVPEFRMLIIDVETGRQTSVRYPRLVAVRMNDSPFSAGMTWWSSDSRTAYFVDIERGEQTANVVAVNRCSGDATVLFSECSDTYVELSVNVYAPALIFPIPETNELLWYSERSGRGHLYLYCLEQGTLKSQTTSGEWQVREVLHVDKDKREVFFLASGISVDEDPYICKPCVGSLDGSRFNVVGKDPGEHIVWRPGEFSLLAALAFGFDINRISGLSPNGEYFVETVGFIGDMPETILRTRNGQLVEVLESPDVRELPETWVWPEPVVMTAADRETNIYGIVIRPPGFDETKKYPVIDYVYGGPQVNVVPKIAFGSLIPTNTLTSAAHLASLGAVVVVIDGRGTGYRERDFRTQSYRAVQDASNLEDHIAGLKQLSAKYPWMDIDRVGICGFSGGGYLTALAATRYGDFYKVAVAGGGNYNQATFWHVWGERYHGEFDENHYATQAVGTYATQKQAKLLLIHGLMDAGCNPVSVFQLVQALIDANKDYDLVLMPRAGHELTSYGVRKQLDYFTTHLLKETPPADFSIKLLSDGIAERFIYSAAIPQGASK